MPIRSAQLAAARRAAESRADRQAGVISAAQARSCGLSEDGVRRLLDRGDWVRLHRGVYLCRHPPGLSARMWAAHLAVGGRGVVAGRAAGHHWGLLDGDLPPASPVLVLLPEPLHLRPDGLATRRVPDPWAWAHPARQPPVLAVEHAVLDLVGRAPAEEEAAGILLRACRERLTTPGRLWSAAQEHTRLRRRALVASLCQDAQIGIMSPLERRYARDVSRAHGLPRGRRQVAARSRSGRLTYRDVQYDAHGVLVELDGRLGHERESEVLRDQLRDNAATLDGWATLRFGWLAVASRPCDVAAQVAALLAARGWRGAPRSCSPRCEVGSGRAQGSINPVAS
jgi:hypothetical protein